MKKQTNKTALKTSNRKVKFKPKGPIEGFGYKKVLNNEL